MQLIKRLPIVGVIGSGRDPHEILAGEIGRLLAGLGVHLLTGGGQGVMAVVSQAFNETESRKGFVIGILPCREDDTRCRLKPGYPNSWVEIAVATHLPLSGTRGTEPMSRNHVNVLSSDAVIALPGGPGTASETLLAIRYEKPVIAYLSKVGRIPGLDPSIPVAQEIGEVEEFLRERLLMPSRSG